MTSWTIKKLLEWITEYLTEKNIDSPRLSAEMLLSHVLQMQRIELYTNFDKAVDAQNLARLRELVKRAAQDEPVAYLIGRTEFYSLGIIVNRNCLIPRPETELLTERAIEFLRLRKGRQLVLDLCTGSGCIAVAIAKNFPEADLIATDISDEALKAAAENVENHNLSDRVKLLCGDLFDPIVQHLDKGKFDLIVCNPPYVSNAEFNSLEKNVRDYEPKGALLAGDDGLVIYKRLCQSVDEFLKPDGALMLEIGYSQGNQVRELLEQTGVFAEITIEKDFADNDRVVTARKQSTEHLSDDLGF
jgi:release factor glutamine methyltransferase